MNFMKQRGLPCVILCGGKGTRLFPHTLNKQKTMLKINQKPLLGYVIDYWKKFTNCFIFVAAYKQEQLFDFISKLPIQFKFISEKEPKGIANALYLAKKYCSNNFICALGDCICWGKFDYPEEFSQGVGVWRTTSKEAIKRSYSIEISNNILSNVKEKPTKIINNLCGMGIYFFNKIVFDFIKKTKPSTLTGKVEITDVIQNMIDSGLDISPIYFKGDYINVTYSEDLHKAEQILLKKAQSKVNSNIS